jgi:nitrogenase molybdenum-iron protein NifN
MTNVAMQLPVTGPFVATRNACKLCTPLGACLAFAGVEGARTILHGSQGCATYIRRYMISHFKEPVDIASSNFSESATIFGGRENLRAALANVVRQYQPGVIGVATTCLAETIGEDVKMYLHEIRSEPPATGSELPPIVHVATPSYCGTHAEGFAATVRALVAQMAESGSRGRHVNVFAGMFSPADLRYLKEILTDFQLPATLLPDYSDTLDGPSWEEYELIPRGGTPLQAVRRTGQANGEHRIHACPGCRSIRRSLAGSTLPRPRTPPAPADRHHGQRRAVPSAPDDQRSHDARSPCR